METADASAALAPPARTVAAAPDPAEATSLPPAPSSLPASRDEVRAHVTWAAVTVGALMFIFLVLRNLPSIGWPLVLATIGAYLCDPIVTWATAKGLSRTVATGLLLAVGLLLSAVVLAEGVPKIVDQVQHLPRYTVWAVGAVTDRLNQTWPSLLRDTSVPRDVEQLAIFFQEHVHDIAAQVLPKAGDVVSTVVGGSLSVLSFILGALVVPVVGFFLLRGWPQIVQSADGLVPSRQRPFVRTRMREIDRVLSGFVRGQLTMAGVLSVIYSSALTLIGLKLAVVVGLATGFGNLVPYVGTSTGVLLSVSFCLVDFGVDYHLALVLGTFAVLVACDSLFITPRIVGPRVGLSPAAVIVAVLTCGSLFGFGGVLLAVPSAAVLKVVFRTLADTWRRSRTFREG
jgi:predicted PurR-regulated permease PerM